MIHRLYLAFFLAFLGFLGPFTLSICTCCGAEIEETNPELPFTVPEGFRVELAADDKLVHDCFCMTTDGLGRPLVSGPGYIKTLVDDNNDGRFDRAITWSSLPQQGAQGLWSEGRKVFWIGDNGLWSSEDQNGDLVADQNVTKLLDVPTGSEHFVHAIRRGPDGYWYMIVGNFANGITKLLNDPNSPVDRPRSGTIWRMSPDFTTKSVWAHGMRNCYDFDFLPDGQIVTFDSDCEREATLPWYRPNRVMVLGPGSDAGWCGQTWKDHDHHITMPQTIASLGRGSPTGVAVYSHTQFPTKYRDAVFVLDWTFGRVMAVLPSTNLPETQRIAGRVPAEVFMQTTGSAGFAPTDVCVSPDGSLLVCTGGRGTAGAIYRVSAISPNDAPAYAAKQLFATAIQSEKLTEPNAELLLRTLTAPCPWESWSETRWRKDLTQKHLDWLLQMVTGEVPIDASEQDALSLKLRAAQALTRINTSVPSAAVIRAVSSKSIGSQTGGWWLAGRGVVNGLQRDALKIQSILPSFADQSAMTPWGEHLGIETQRLCLEAFGLRKWPMARFEPFPVASTPSGTALRRTWLWALNRSPSPLTSKSDAAKLDTLIAKRLFGPNAQSLDTKLLDFLANWIPKAEPKMNSQDRLEFLAILQASLGDRRATLPQQTDPPNPDVLDGYRATSVRQLPASVRKGWIDWLTFLILQAEKQGDDLVESDGIRTLAMLEPNDPKVVDFLLTLASDKSHPTFDLQLLCAVACSSGARTTEASDQTAEILFSLVRKVKQGGLYTDNQWPKRLQQLVSVLLAKDAAFAEAFARVPGQCCPEDIVLLNAFPADTQAKIRDRMRRELMATDPKSWSSTIVRYALQSHPLTPDLINALRIAVTEPTLRSVGIELLSNYPNEVDYPTYLEVLKDQDRNLWSWAWRGLQPLPVKTADDEWPVLAKLVSEVCNVTTPLPKDAVLVRTRKAANQLGIANVPNSSNWPDWDSFLKENTSEECYSHLTFPMVKQDWSSRLTRAGSLAGNLDRGQAIFQQKCLSCHGGQSALGPSLGGVTKRFSRMDLGTAIFEPSRDISDRYKAVQILTVDGEIFTGVVVYSAADGTTIYTAKGEMVRVNKAEIEELAYSTQSLMPLGLLDDNNDQEIADLLAYLSSL